MPKKNEYKEYGIFNRLPDGLTITDIPQEARWLYTEPFRVFNDWDAREQAEVFVRQVNRTRDRNKGLEAFQSDPQAKVRTQAFIRVRTVTVGKWSDLS